MGPNWTLLGRNHRIDRMDIPLIERGDADDPAGESGHRRR
jgi:hypothetical protein